MSECSICLEKMNNDDTITTECHHIFHKKCLDSSIKFSVNCPLCRSDISSLYPDILPEYKIQSRVTELIGILEDLPRQYLLNSFKNVVRQLLMSDLLDYTEETYQHILNKIRDVEEFIIIISLNSPRIE